MSQNTQAMTAEMASLNMALFRHPLYELLDPNGSEREIHVLILGFREIGRKFADLCLQVGQMDGYAIHIAAISGDPGRDLSEYCQGRPAIREFVDVNGSMNGAADSYGVLNIESLSSCAGSSRFADITSPDHAADNQDSVLSILCDAVGHGYRYHYIFIAEENNDLNLELAQICGDETTGQKDRCPVAYVAGPSSPEEKSASSGRIFPVYIGTDDGCVQEDAGAKSILDREAFCTHLSWKSDLNFDMEKERAKFMADEYNYQSSCEFALSIGYKLYSVGIVLRRDWIFPDEEAGSFYIAEDEQDAAAEYSRRVLDGRKENADVQDRFQRLVALEHRRWVISLLSGGWTAPKDKKGNYNLQTCIDTGRVKNKERKTHPCLVRSCANSPLEGPEYDIRTEEGRKKWDEDKIDPALDPLDRMSIDLHRLFVRKADQRKYETITENGKEVRRPVDPLTREEFAAIRAAVRNADDRVNLAFRQFEFCIRNIFSGEISYTRQYDNYRTAFENMLSGAQSENRKNLLSEETVKSIAENLAEIDRIIFPVREANLYRNYKTYDNDLVENLPFIMTWKLQPAIAMGFDDARMVGGRNDAVFADVASATVICPSRILYLYCYDDNTDPEHLVSRLRAVRNYIRTRNIHCEITFLSAYPEERNSGDAGQLAEQLSGKFSDFKESDGVTTFHAPAPYLCATVGEAAQYFQNCITGMKDHIEGSADLFDASTPVFSSPVDNAMFLNQLMCGTGEDSSDTVPVPHFEFDGRRKRFYNLAGCEYLSYCRDGSFIRIDDMFALQNAGVNYAHFDKSTQFPDFTDRFDEIWDIYTGSYCGGNAANRFKTGIADWNRLFTALSGMNTEDKIKGIVIGEDKTPEADGVQDLLNALNKAGFISGLTVRKSTASSGKNGRPNLTADFTYLSPKLRTLLGVEGAMLEVHAYYSALKTGYFDEVACGYQFDWESGNVRNEIDLILTKGFRSIIVECKNVDKLEADYYYKLCSVADHFGIGTIKVLIGNTAKGEPISSDDVQQSRGRQMDIVTISGEKQINNVGEELKKLMRNC